MNGTLLPIELILSFTLALMALVLNTFSPGAAAVAGAVAALIFLKLLVTGR